MLIFDQLKKDDAQLRFLAVVVACGMAVLFVGLWWVQVVSGRYYQGRLENQSVRSVRVPAVRGNILDRDGRPLAQNRPGYNVDLYFEDLSRSFQTSYSAALSRARTNLALQKAAAEKQLHHKPSKPEQKKLDHDYAMTEKLKTQIQNQARFEVCSNIVADLGARLGQGISFEQKDYQRRYDTARALPVPILANLNPNQVARFEEQSMHVPGMDLDVQSVRHYPNGTLAAHLLGYLGRDNPIDDGKKDVYSYRLDEYIGRTGIEKIMDQDLHGVAGAKNVLINNLGYRQRESVWVPAEPGANVVLTIDVDIQKTAETALKKAQADVRGAVVVMDADSGDVIALASAPTYDPNFFVEHHDSKEWAAEINYLQDTNSKPELNRATFDNRAPGSIFKIVVALAALEQGVLDPNATYDSPGAYALPGMRKPIGDLAPAGPYNLERALAKSSNCYFIQYGIQPGVLAKIIALGQHLHLGEHTKLLPYQDAPGSFPKLHNTDAAHGWYLADTAYLSIGQGQIAVTPTQMAVMTAAVANGGKVLWPRLISRIEPYGSDEPTQTFPAGRIRDTLPVSQRSLGIVRDAMKAEVERPDGTGRRAAVPGLSIAGKTGTAEAEINGHKAYSARTTWFVSFAPVGNARYVVVAMVEGGDFGGTTCAPIAHDIYEALQKREHDHERKPASKLGTLAEIQ